MKIPGYFYLRLVHILSLLLLFSLPVTPLQIRMGLPLLFTRSTILLSSVNTITSVVASTIIKTHPPSALVGSVKNISRYSKSVSSGPRAICYCTNPISSPAAFWKNQEGYSYIRPQRYTCPARSYSTNDKGNSSMPVENQNNDASLVEQSTPSSDSAPKPLLALPSTETAEPTITLDVSTGEGVKMDHLGPIVVNVDGTLARITNWDQMAEIEQKNVVRVITMRNKNRLQALKKKEQEEAPLRDLTNEANTDGLAIQGEGRN